KPTDFVEWNETSGEREFIILHCGGFLPTKGQELMLQIARKLSNKNLKFKILLVGIIYKGGASENYYNKIKNLIVEYGLVNYVELIVNPQNVIPYFVQCDVLVHPTHSEGLPRVVMEAMAFGKPVIGNAAGGMTDYISDGITGYLTNFD